MRRGRRRGRVEWCGQSDGGMRGNYSVNGSLMCRVEEWLGSVIDMAVWFVPQFRRHHNCRCFSSSKSVVLIVEAGIDDNDYNDNNNGPLLEFGWWRVTLMRQTMRNSTRVSNWSKELSHSSSSYLGVLPRPPRLCHPMQLPHLEQLLAQRRRARCVQTSLARVKEPWGTPSGIH